MVDMSLELYRSFYVDMSLKSECILNNGHMSRWFEEHHPEQGNFTHESDRDAIRAVLAKQVSIVDAVLAFGVRVSVCCLIICDKGDVARQKASSPRVDRKLRMCRLSFLGLGSPSEGREGRCTQ